MMSSKVTLGYLICVRKGRIPTLLPTPHLSRPNATTQTNEHKTLSQNSLFPNKTNINRSIFFTNTTIQNPHSQTIQWCPVHAHENGRITHLFKPLFEYTPARSRRFYFWTTNILGSSNFGCGDLLPHPISSNFYDTKFGPEGGHLAIPLFNPLSTPIGIAIFNL